MISLSLYQGGEQGDGTNLRWSLSTAVNDFISPCRAIIPIPPSDYFKDLNSALNSSKKRPFCLRHDGN